MATALFVCLHNAGRSQMRYIDWALPDPKAQPLADVRVIRDGIDRRVRMFVAELDGSSRG